jgi:hypothetical protein
MLSTARLLCYNARKVNENVTPGLPSGTAHSRPPCAPALLRRAHHVFAGVALDIYKLRRQSGLVHVSDFDMPIVYGTRIFESLAGAFFNTIHSCKPDLLSSSEGMERIGRLPCQSPRHVFREQSVRYLAVRPRGWDRPGGTPPRHVQCIRLWHAVIEDIERVVLEPESVDKSLQRHRISELPVG